MSSDSEEQSKRPASVVGCVAFDDTSGSVEEQDKPPKHNAPGTSMQQQHGDRFWPTVGWKDRFTGGIGSGGSMWEAASGVVEAPPQESEASTSQALPPPQHYSSMVKGHVATVEDSDDSDDREHSSFARPAFPADGTATATAATPANSIEEAVSVQQQQPRRSSSRASTASADSAASSVASARSWATGATHLSWDSVDAVPDISSANYDLLLGALRMAPYSRPSDACDRIQAYIAQLRFFEPFTRGSQSDLTAARLGMEVEEGAPADQGTLALQRAADCLKLAQVAEGEAVVKQGTQSRGLFIIMRGSVSIRKKTAKEVELDSQFERFEEEFDSALARRASIASFGSAATQSGQVTVVVCEHSKALCLSVSCR